MCVAVAPASAPAKSLRVKAHPSLFPKFRRSVHYYVSRCGRKHPLGLSVRPGSGETISLGRRGHRRSRAFHVALRRRESQETSLVSRRHGRSASYYVRCLPRKFPPWSVRTRGPRQAGFYVIAPAETKYAAVFDTNGVPIWWMRADTIPFDAKLLPNNHIAFSRHRTGERFGVYRSDGWEEHTLTGRLVGIRRTVGSPTDHHDMQPLANDDWLMISYRRRDHADLRPYGGPRDATVIEPVVQEVDRRGKVTWQWSARNRISPKEQGPLLAPPVPMPDGTQAYDLMHLNSVQFHGNRLLVSCHAMDAVYDVDRSTKQIVWKLGGTQTPQRLMTIGDPNEGRFLFGGQHNARMLPDGTVTVFDNATGLDRPPRAARYRIDEKSGTAQLLESLPKPKPVRRSAFGGSATRLPGGHWVVSWGGMRYVDELTARGKQALSLTFKGGIFSYKVDTIRRGVLTRARLRRAMNAMPWRLRG